MLEALEQALRAAIKEIVEQEVTDMIDERIGDAIDTAIGDIDWEDKVRDALGSISFSVTVD